MTKRGTPRPRRALSQPVGPIAVRGEGATTQVLRGALQAQSGPADQLTHGFHTYPARIHPAIARACIAAFSRPGARVLDPFCGSGGVLVEAMVAGRSALGVDLNPVAIRIAEVQCALRGRTERERFVEMSGRVTQASLVRVRSRTKVKAPLSAAERAFYDPHVLLELAGLHAEIARVEEPFDRRALQVVFSSLVVKFSRQRADTSEQRSDKRIRKGLVSEFFERKAHELAKRWTALAHAAGPRAQVPQLLAGDARQLPVLLAQQKDFDLVLSSPPYGGTYDYHAHHSRRYPWFGLDASVFERDEVGARRRLSRSEGGAMRWERELTACLRAIAGVTRADARIVLLLGDAQLAGSRVDAGDQLARLADGAGLEWLAAAAQQRPDPQGGSPRQEHLVLLRRSGGRDG